MKKWKNFLLSTFIAVLSFCMLLLTACGGVEGTYKLKSVEYEGKVYELGETLMDATVAEDILVIKLYEDGTGEMRMKMGNEFEDEDFHWEEADGKLTFYDDLDDPVVVAERDGDTLTLKMGGITYNLEKE